MFKPFTLFFVLFASMVLCAPKGNGSISGIVTDKQTGKSLSGVTVYLEGLGKGCPNENWITTQTGKFTFSNLPPGSYRVSAFKQGYQKVVYGETKEDHIGEHIVLVPSDMSAQLSIALPLGAGISGHVYDSNGNPVPGCDVQLDPVGIMGIIYFIKTDSTGYYWISDLPEGSYLVSAQRFSANGKITGDRWYYPGRVSKESAEQLNLTAGKTAAIDLYLSDEKKVVWTGRVRGPQEEPIAGAQIRRIRFLEKTTDVQDACWTNKAGECSLVHLDQGEYWFFIQSAPAPYAAYFDMKLDRPEKATGYAKQAWIQDGAQAVVTDFHLKKGRTLEGKFYFADSSPAVDPGMKVYLTYQRQVPGTTVTLPALTEGSFDSFTIYGIHPELEYRMEIWSSDQRKYYYPIRIVLDGNDITQSDTIRVAASDASKMEVFIARAATIAATGSAEFPVWEADWTDGPSYPQLAYMNHQFVAMSGQGKFIFRGLPPGAYTIHPQNRTEPSGKITVEAGETREINIAD
jgi:hypothetical protein